MQMELASLSIADFTYESKTARRGKFFARVVPSV